MTMAGDTAATKGPIAYLTGEYPKVSHTFIQREIATLRAAGWEVETCTVRRASPRDIVADQLEEVARTFAILETAKSPFRLIRDHFETLKRDPRAWGRAAALAWRTRPAGAKALLWQLFYFLEAGVLAEHLRARGVRHLHNHFANSSCSVAMLTSEMSDIPFSFTMHGPAIFYEPLHWRIDEKIKRAAFVSCISHFCRSQAMYFSDPKAWEKLKIVHCGVTPDLYGRADDTARPVRVVFVGRLDPVKGVPLLIDAFERVAARHADVELCIVGDGPARVDCEVKVARAGLSERVTFKGYQTSEAVAEILGQSDVLVLPSFAEGVPVVLMEAMATGLPVIASQVAGVGELIEDGVSGFTIPAGDLDTLTARLERLLSDADLRARMGAAGRAAVEKSFNLETEGAWLGEIIEGSLNGALPDGLRSETAD
ncbi:glycosyltransferase [Celeribacter sp.]|uniref:glycosyltransferase n=1 Tax=Celeribacter sp. TaxID=1890673 RepID=UPI003A8DAFEB